MRSHGDPDVLRTVFRRTTTVELLRSRLRRLHDVLVKIAEQLEFGLKVLWDRDVMIGRSSARTRTSAT